MTTPYSQHVAQCQARQSYASELRSRGLTLQEIGNIVGCTRQRAHQLIAKARKRGKGKA